VSNVFDRKFSLVVCANCSHKINQQQSRRLRITAQTKSTHERKESTMALSRQHPFSFRTPFDEFFDMPAFAFPREMTPFRSNSLDNASDSFWRHPYTVHEDDKSYTLSVDVPGVRPQDMTVKVEENNVLHLSGGRKIENQGCSGFSERKFDYRLTLGDNVDAEKVTANMQDGVLKLTAPKIEVKKPKTRLIKISDGPAAMPLDVEKKEAK
jgi:HSP20 family protein